MGKLAHLQRLSHDGALGIASSGFLSLEYPKSAKLAFAEAIDLPMEPAGSVEVTVTHPDGTPLVGANVYTNPNQMLDKSGSQVVGTCYSSMSLIQAKLDDSERRLLEQVVKEYRNSRYYQTTDANGHVVLHDLPINGFPYRLGFSHPEFNAIAKSGTSKSTNRTNRTNRTKNRTLFPI